MSSHPPDPIDSLNPLLQLATEVLGCRIAWVTLNSNSGAQIAAQFTLSGTDDEWVQLANADCNLQGFVGTKQFYKSTFNSQWVNLNGFMAVASDTSFSRTPDELHRILSIFTELAAALIEAHSLRDQLASSELAHVEIENGLRETELKYRSIFENAVDGFFQTSPQGTYIAVNTALAKIYGYDTPADLIAAMSDISRQLYVEPDRRQEFIRSMQEHQTITNFQSRIYRRDGSTIWISEDVRAVRDSNGTLLRYEGTVKDITTQKTTEDALQSSEHLYHSLVETLPQNIFRKDLDGRFTFANQRFCQTIGLPLDQIIGRKDADLFPKELAEKYCRDDQRVMATLQPIDTAESHKRPGEQSIHVQVVKSPLYDANGRLAGVQGMFWDITERKQTEEQLAFERDLLRALLENVPDRIFIKDTASRFVRCSLSLAKALKAASADDVLGKTDYDFHSEAKAKAQHADEQKVILTGRSRIDTEHHTDANGNPVWDSVSKVPFRNRTGLISGIIGISRDITPIKKAESEMALARDLAVEAAALKSQFLAVMSHEIRTPMNGIIGMIDLLLSSELTHEQRDHADTLRTSADALLEILNDILDLSKIEAGKMELRTEEFKLRDLIEDATGLHSARAQAKAITLDCWIPSDVDGTYNGDAGRTRQVLLNLISNAVKFTDQGGVQVSVHTRTADTGMRMLRFEVNDSGVGINQDLHDKIFEAFRQGDSSLTRRHGGTGLGLTISKEISQMMGGSIGLTSSHGVGSTFWFEIPSNPVTVNSAKSNLSSITVAIIEPDNFRHQLIADYCRSICTDVVQFNSFTDALDDLKNGGGSHHYITNFHAGEMDPLDFIHAARTLKPDLQFTTYTTAQRKTDPETAVAAGINVLTLPIRRLRLTEALLCLPTANRVGTIESQTPMGTGYPFQIALVEDNPVNQKVAEIQLRKLGCNSETLSDGMSLLAAWDSFQVVLMDCQLPDLDGFETTRRLRQLEQSTATKDHKYVIALTANIQDRADCYSAGMDDFISKPLRLAELKSALDRAADALKNSSTHSTDSLLDPTNLNALKPSATDPSPDVTPEIVNLFLSQTASYLAELDQHIHDKNLHAIASIAHKLKGSSANLGAKRLAALGLGLEHAVIDHDLKRVTSIVAQIPSTFRLTRLAIEKHLHPDAG